MNLRLDSHVDTLHRIYKMEYANYDLQSYRFDLDVDIPKLVSSGVNSCFFALFIKQDCDFTEAGERLIKLFYLMSLVLKNNYGLILSNNPDEILTDIKSKVSVSLGLENGFPIGFNLGMVEFLFNRGIRYITLCHNKSNQICDSSTDYPVYNGLSDFGKLLVKEMNKSGIMVDVSHLSDQSVSDVLDISELPIVATHSCCYSICNNPRNLNDHLLEKIAKNNGVVQVTLLPKCVGGNKDISSFVDHIDHLKKIIGIDYIGIGSDFDGGGGLIDCENASEMGNITIELVNRGYSEEEINKIWGLNFLRVYSSQGR